MNFGKNSRRFSLKFVTILVLKRSSIGIHASNMARSVIFFTIFNHFLSRKQENEDPRRMHRVIDFILTLIKSETTSNTFNETSRWSLIRNLNEFKWRIPSIWCEVNEHAKGLLDHPSPGVRERIAK
jgi:hypothetical protein